MTSTLLSRSKTEPSNIEFLGAAADHPTRVEQLNSQVIMIEQLNHYTHTHIDWTTTPMAVREFSTPTRQTTEGNRTLFNLMLVAHKIVLV